VELINTQEDVEEYKEQYNRIQDEGKALYNTYVARCARLKDTSARLDQAKEVRRFEIDDGGDERERDYLTVTLQDVARLEKENVSMKEKVGK